MTPLASDDLWVHFKLERKRRCEPCTVPNWMGLSPSRWCGRWHACEGLRIGDCGVLELEHLNLDKCIAGVLGGLAELLQPSQACMQVPSVQIHGNISAPVVYSQFNQFCIAGVRMRCKSSVPPSSCTSTPEPAVLGYRDTSDPAFLPQ